MVSAILLAAGESKRMGERDKLFLKYKGDWIINHVMRNLWPSKKSELIIVMQNNDNNLLDRKSMDELKVVVNSDYKKGMTTSIQAGVRAASEDSNGFMICLADQPLMQTADYDEIIDRFALLISHDPMSIILPFYKEQKGNPVIFSSYYKETILSHQNMEGCKEIVRDHQEHVYKVAMNNDHVLRDVDTPEDYEGLLS